MREPPNIPVDDLYACLREHYGLAPTTITFLPLGKDYDAGTYRVESASGPPFFLKITSRPLDAASCLVPHYLRDLGISAIVAPVATRDGSLWTRLRSWLVLLYPFVAGQTGWATMTDAAWREAGAIFRRIHDAPLPPVEMVTLRRETYDPSAYAEAVRRFEAEHLGDRVTDSPAERALRESWRTHQATIAEAIASLEIVAPLLSARGLPDVLCHADLHPGNLLRDAAGHVHVIDWDEVMLAPRERDFIFVRELQADSFWEGYGATEIDWYALTYFLWERAVQDILACSDLAVLRDDQGEASKAENAELFASIFAPGGTLDAAYAAAAHLPAALGLPTSRRP